MMVEVQAILLVVDLVVITVLVILGVRGTNSQPGIGGVGVQIPNIPTAFSR